MKKINFFVAIIFKTLIFSQSNLQTNVDENYLNPKWMSQPLSADSYRNGIKLLEVKDEFEFSKINRPAYYVKKIDGKDNYFYNQRVLWEGDTIAPKGYRVANILDYFYLFGADTSQIENLNIPNWNFESKFIESIKIPFDLKFNGFIDEGYAKDKRQFYIWTDYNSKNNIEEAISLKFTRDSEKEISKCKYSFVNRYKGYGCQIYCVENIDEIIKDSVFNYKKLLPNDYNKIALSISPIIFNSSNISDTFKVSLKGFFETNKNGFISQSTFSVISDELKLDKLESKIDESIRSKITIPYYKGNILMSHGDINFTFSGVPDDQNKKTVYNSLIFKREILLNDSTLQYAFDNGFKVSTQTLEIFDGKESIYKSINLYDFKSSGPLNSIGCLLPGLGMSFLTKDCNYNCIQRKRIANSFLACSISLGLISISSKIYSKFYYNRYLNDLYGNNAEKNYKNANISQKIFLSSLMGYGVLGALDFTFTFYLGSLNKTKQIQLNQRIKEGEKISIR